MEIKSAGNLSHASSVANDATSKASADSTDKVNVSQTNATHKTAFRISKDYQNSSILAAQEKVSIASGDQSMALLYRAAVDSINTELEPSMGTDAIQKGMDAGVDYSPEATADRIVSFATNFFQMHQNQNHTQGFNDQLNGFMDKISGAIDTGFNDAKGILDGLKVLNGDIATGVDQTYDLVQQGLSKFKENTLSAHTSTSSQTVSVNGDAQ
ncbi:DUF5610 domain-containing protein [Shewanella intestini]|uniref:DUF5610 domain-containing protein n=1 Tax=Shewanella intestini TaxID=2017544 RepID=A0ABS5I5U9_9GAMM|nr:MULTISPECIES: DUF5610 domain-containing protein [Shewanella]MBR9729392.1 hypothetical protein [Shewanella intestini]MRG37472.1 hypothetical protein [Shewanella sp. XMDDZSB0408]